jgi:hypothetical protein
MKIILLFLLTLSLTILTHGYNRRTEWDSWGKGNTIYLDRHDVTCNKGELLQGFTLKVPFEQTINYEYDCLKYDYDGKAEEMLWGSDMVPSADNTFTETKSADKLSKIPVKCKKDNYALRQFKLETICPGWPLNVCFIKYNFWCAPIQTTKCSTGKTDWYDAQDGSILDLSHIPIELSKNNVLRGFKLNVEYYERGLLKTKGKKFQYEYDFCEVSSSNNGLVILE